MSQDQRFDLGIMLMLLLPPLRVSNAEPLAEHFSNSFQGHTFTFGVEEDHKHPAEEADTGIEAESTTGRPILHHREECRGDYDVCAPAGNSVLSMDEHWQINEGKRMLAYQHCSNGSDLKWNQLRANPSNGGNARGKARHVAYNRDKDQSTRPADMGSLQSQSLGVDWDIAKGNDSHHHADGHPKHSDRQDDPATEFINKYQINEREDEIRARNCDPDSSGVIEPDDGEEGRGIIHQRVESPELADCHNHARSQNRTTGSRGGENTPEGDPEGFLGHCLRGLLKGQFDRSHLGFTLTRSRRWVDSQEYGIRCGAMAMGDQLSR